jgi:ligand-binding SRPBCC domain-containing protein
MPRFVHSSVIDAPVERVFAFHEAPGALEALTPPFAPVRVVRREGGIQPGGVVELEVPVGPFKRRWVARHTDYIPNELFVDVQESGPFRRWVHHHRFEAVGAGRTRLTDEIDFSLPGGALMDFLGGWFARIQLRRMFRYRHEATRRAVMESR